MQSHQQVNTIFHSLVSNVPTVDSDVEDNDPVAADVKSESKQEIVPTNNKKELTPEEEFHPIRQKQILDALNKEVTAFDAKMKEQIKKAGLIDYAFCTDEIKSKQLEIMYEKDEALLSSLTKELYHLIDQHNIKIHVTKEIQKIQDMFPTLKIPVEAMHWLNEGAIARIVDDEVAIELASSKWSAILQAAIFIQLNFLYFFDNIPVSKKIMNLLEEVAIAVIQETVSKQTAIESLYHDIPMWLIYEKLELKSVPTSASFTKLVEELIYLMQIKTSVLHDIKKLRHACEAKHVSHGTKDNYLLAFRSAIKPHVRDEDESNSFVSAKLIEKRKKNKKDLLELMKRTEDKSVFQKTPQQITDKCVATRVKEGDGLVSALELQKAQVMQLQGKRFAMRLYGEYQAKLNEENESFQKLRQSSHNQLEYEESKLKDLNSQIVEKEVELKAMLNAMELSASAALEKKPESQLPEEKSPAVELDQENRDPEEQSICKAMLFSKKSHLKVTTSGDHQHRLSL